MSFTAFQKGHTGSADEVQANFLFVGQGSLAPRGGTALEVTTGVYDLGSSIASWNQAYVNTINLGSGTVQRCMNMIAEVTLTATASSIEFTGLNGEVDEIYEIISNVKTNGVTCIAYGYFNNDSATSDYGYQTIYAYSTVYVSERTLSYSGLFLGRFCYNTTTAIFSKSKFLIYANNTIKLILSEISTGIINTVIELLFEHGQVWNNSATLTSFKIVLNTTTAYFDPNTHIEIWAKR